MSVWTHVAGTIRIDDLGVLIGQPTDFLKVFIRNTWTHRNKNGNMPTGSEGSLDVEVIERNEEDSAAYFKTISIFGDLRDFDKEKCNSIREWWKNISKRCGKTCLIRQAVLQVIPEDGESFILTEKDMDIEENKSSIN